jgi:hypothetical protein
VNYEAAIELPPQDGDVEYHLDVYTDALVDDVPIAKRSLPDVPVE